MDTFFIPPERKTQSPATWNNYDGAQNKQIDFFAISNINKNWVTNVSNKHPANPHFIMQHKMLRISIKIKLKNPKNIIKDADVQYDIYKLRKEPKVLEETVEKILQNHTHNIKNWNDLTAKLKKMHSSLNSLKLRISKNKTMGHKKH